MPKMKMLLLLLFVFMTQVSWAEDYILIINKNNPIHTLKRADIKKIFLGKKSFWDNGHRIEVFLQAESKLHDNFISEVVRKSPRQFKMYWRRELYSGTGLPPQKLENDQAVKTEVANNPRAIGYISTNSIDDTVKWVRIVD